MPDLILLTYIQKISYYNDLYMLHLILKIILFPATIDEK